MRFWLILGLVAFSMKALALELDGHTDFAQKIVLNSSISGRVASIEVEEGQRVSTGDLLLRLDPTGLQAGADIARAERDALVPALENMQTELDKAQELFDRDSLAMVELQTAERNHATATARLAAAEARLVRALYRLSQSEIRSPIDGVVIELGTYVGQFINTRASDPALLTVADRRKMAATALLPLESYKDNLRKARAGVGFRDQRFDGKVVDIGSQVTTGDNDHPALTVTVEFTTDGNIPAGLPVKISIAD